MISGTLSGRGWSMRGGNTSELEAEAEPRDRAGGGRGGTITDQAAPPGCGSQSSPWPCPGTRLQTSRQRWRRRMVNRAEKSRKPREGEEFRGPGKPTHLSPLWWKFPPLDFTMGASYVNMSRFNSHSCQRGCCRSWDYVEYTHSKRPFSPTSPCRD